MGRLGGRVGPDGKGDLGVRSGAAGREGRPALHADLGVGAVWLGGRLGLDEKWGNLGCGGRGGQV